ncbi:MAG: Gfo/Idh/MocA family oxidoreductase [Bryobacterales bacterium]|nr:Gfo/Idh/MocA family oxidoreductase [Bryobacteraceae bacterium]MDW8131139.1 Gfo/Idh/MocA family oxidoreductase [Bryobacterales bacterium]
MSESNRRHFLMGAAALGLAGRTLARTRPAQGRVIGANDRIHLGIIGMGGRGMYLGRVFSRIGSQNNSCQIVAVCDVYQKRLNAAKEAFKCDGYLDYREILNRNDVDAVIIATPDHWHARQALEAMDRGKDVYLEKPMCHTIEEVRQLIHTVRETKRVLQVGSQTTSGDQWWKAKKLIADGAIGPMIMSQGSYHRNSREGEWNWKIDPDAGPDKTGENYIDWKMWLGPAPKRPWNPDRFFRFRKYWDYSGGIATDLFFHVAAPLNICWSRPQYPYKVMAGGSISVFKDEREVPDTFHLIAEYAAGHTVVLTSSMANSQHIPGLIRGHLGTIIMVEHGQFERPTEHIILRPERRVIDEDYKAKFGDQEVKVPVEQRDAMTTHANNFLECIRTRQKPTLDVETAACAQVLITMSVLSYREGRILYFDEKAFKVVSKPPRLA